MTQSTKQGTGRPSPAELRSRLGANLRQLSRSAVSISELCRQLGINRTQYNRYLAGESFPRPDVLYRICDFFGVDARILLEPVDDIPNAALGVFQHPDIAEFLGGCTREIPEHDLPSGLYRFARRSFSNETQFVQGLNYIFRRDGFTFLRGYEVKDAMRAQGLPTTPAHREFRAVVMPQEDGIAVLAGRKGATTGSFNYLARLPSFENNFWVGYVARTVREGMAGSRVERLAFEYLGDDTGKKLAAARLAGFCTEDELPLFMKNLLKTEAPFV